MLHAHGKKHSLLRLFAVAFLSVVLVACGGGGSGSATAVPEATEKPEATAATKPTRTPKPEPTKAPEANDEVNVVEAVFAKKLSENMEPEEKAPGNAFTPEETIALSLKLAGRPKKGIVEATYFWGEDKIDSAKIDLSDINGGVVISVGENTFLGFTLAPSKPWPISKKYRIDVTLNDKPLDTYSYKVVAEDGAPAANVNEAVLAGGADESFKAIDVATEFKPDKEIYLVGNADFSKGSWLRSEWYVDGKLDAAGTTLLGPVEEDKESTGFSMYYLPKGGWPMGDHEVALIMNDKEIERYRFTITDTPGNAVVGGDDDTMGVTIDKLEEYTHESGVFSIMVPKNWEAIVNDSPGAVSVTWAAPEDTSGVFVNIATTEKSLSEDDLAEYAKKFNDDIFGKEDEYTLNDPETQTDGSVLQHFTMNPTINGKAIMLQGLTYAEQRGDKVSILTLIYPYSEDDRMWESHFKEIANSYSIDKNAVIP